MANFNCLLFICIINISFAYKSYKDYKLYEVSGDKIRVDKLVKYVEKYYDVPATELLGSKTHIILPTAAGKVLEEVADIAEIQVRLIIDDYSQVILSETVSERGKTEFSWTAYYDVDDIYKYLHNTSQAYPDLTEVIVGGETYEGRQILGLRINDRKGDDKPVMFIESGIHARERITPATTTYFINQLLSSSNPNITAMRDQFDWRIFPTVNPDGYHYTFTTDRLWRKTRSKSSISKCYGADPNRNWDYNWGHYGSSTDPCSPVYAGSQPFSEIETKTLSEYIAGIEHLLGYVTFHSPAQTLLLPYSDSKEHDDNYDDLVKIGKTSLKYGEAVNGQIYDGPATAAEILYAASGGSMDWVRNSLGTPLVFTYELRGKYFHWPASRIYEQGDEVTQMMLGLVKRAQQLGYF